MAFSPYSVEIDSLHQSVSHRGHFPGPYMKIGLTTKINTSSDGLSDMTTSHSSQIGIKAVILSVCDATELECCMLSNK